MKIYKANSSQFFRYLYIVEKDSIYYCLEFLSDSKLYIDKVYADGSYQIDKPSDMNFMEEDLIGYKSDIDFSLNNKGKYDLILKEELYKFLTHSNKELREKIINLLGILNEDI